MPGMCLLVKSPSHGVSRDLDESSCWPELECKYEKDAVKCPLLASRKK